MSLHRSERQEQRKAGRMTYRCIYPACPKSCSTMCNHAVPVVDAAEPDDGPRYSCPHCGKTKSEPFHCTPCNYDSEAT